MNEEGVNDHVGRLRAPEGSYFSDGDCASVWFVQPPRRFRLDRCKPGAATLRRVGSAATVPAVVSPVAPVVSPVFPPV